MFWWVFVCVFVVVGFFFLDLYFQLKLCKMLKWKWGVENYQLIETAFLINPKFKYLPKFILSGEKECTQ